MTLFECGLLLRCLTDAWCPQGPPASAASRAAAHCARSKPVPRASRKSRSTTSHTSHTSCSPSCRAAAAAVCAIRVLCRRQTCNISDGCATCPLGPAWCCCAPAMALAARFAIGGCVTPVQAFAGHGVSDAGQHLLQYNVAGTTMAGWSRTGDWGGADSVCRPSASDWEATRRPRDRSRSACRSERCSCSRGPSAAPSLQSIHGQCCHYTCSVW